MASEKDLSELDNISLTIPHTPPLTKSSPILSIIVLNYLLPFSVFTVGTVGNMIAILSILLIKRLRNTTNMFLFNLAIADLLFIIFGIPLYRLIHSETFKFNVSSHVRCRIARCTPFLLVICSSITLVVLSLERYLVIMFPLNFNVKFSKTKVVIIIAFIWLLSACLALTPEFLVQRDVNEHCHSNMTQSASDMYMMYTDTIIVYMPLVFMVYFYTRIILKLRMRGRATSSTDTLTLESLHTMRTDNINAKVIKLLICVVLVFFICWTPFTFTSLLAMLNVIKMPQDWIFSATEYLAFLNSCLNPLVYGLVSRNFRDGYKETVLSVCRSCRKGILRDERRIKSQYSTKKPLKIVFSNHEHSSALSDQQRLSPLISTTASASKCTPSIMDQDESYA